MAIKVLIADDHAVIRDGLRMIINAQPDLMVIGDADTGIKALELVETLVPDVVLMDISMPQMNGIEATRLIIQNAPEVRIIILSMHNTSEHVYQALQAGATGYLLKESAGSEVVEALRIVMKRQQYLGRGVDKVAVLSNGKSITQKSPINRLSPRERHVLQLVVEGRTSAEIAQSLNLSPKSVETYRSRMMLKLNISNIPSLVKYAIENGISPIA